MSNRGHLEENTRRLLRAALGSSARPNPEARKQAIDMLANHLRARRTSFPDVVLAALGFLAILAVLWWIGSSLDVASVTIAEASIRLVRLAGILNLLVLPFAGLVIILRRRSNV
jgi:type VI protein secretion system component VasF